MESESLTSKMVYGNCILKEVKILVLKKKSEITHLKRCKQNFEVKLKT